VTQPADRGTAARPWLGTLWVGLVLAVVFATGFVGYLQYRPPGSVPAENWWDLAYYTLQLYGLGFTGVDGVPVPWPLQVARVLAPITFAAAVVSVVALARVNLWWRRITRWGFALVVGDTPEARAVAEATQRRLRLFWGRSVFGVDRGDPAALRAAGLRRARTVYALGDDREDVAANVATALAAVSVRSRSRGAGPRIFVHVTDPDLAVGLRARRLMTEIGQRVEFFTMDEMAARAHIESESLGPDARPEILVAGAGAFGCAAIVAFARHWRRASGRAGERISVILVDEQASRARDELLDRWLVVAESCDITAVDTSSIDAALRSGVAGRPYRAYICYEDEHVALRSALTAAPLWHGGPASLVVRLSRISRHEEAFQDGRLLDHLDGRLVVANVAALAAPYVASEPDVFDDLAQAIHARYLESHLARGDRIGDRPALQPWEKLSAFYQESNRGQARDIPVKLRLVGATVAPRSARNPTFALTEAEVLSLAQREHERWVRERHTAHWRHGAVEDAHRRLHPDLVPWDQLPAESQEKNRDAVRALPQEYDDVLADFGLQIIRC
jgi:hypothetical protein